MENYIYDESNGLWYQRAGDYNIPCLVFGDTSSEPIGRWGKAHLQYIKENRSVIYARRVADGTLHEYLREIDTVARQRFELLTAQMAKSQGVTERLKADDPMAWVQAMNNIRSVAEEVINAEVIFV